VGLTFLDTGAIIGFLDRDDAHHTPASRAIRQATHDGFLAISAVTYAELLAGARLGHHEETDVTGFIDGFVRDIVAVDAHVADLAATIRATHGLRTPDALILAGAQHAGADLVLSTDGRWTKLGDFPITVDYIPTHADT
jgi:predicted nucleic acid-binding protein